MQSINYKNENVCTIPRGTPPAGEARCSALGGHSKNSLPEPARGTQQLPLHCPIKPRPNGVRIMINFFWLKFYWI